MIRTALAAVAWLIFASPVGAYPLLCTTPCARQCLPATGTALAQCEAKCAVQRKIQCAVVQATPIPPGKLAKTGNHAAADWQAHSYVHRSAPPAPAPLTHGQPSVAEAAHVTLHSHDQPAGDAGYAAIAGVAAGALAGPAAHPPGAPDHSDAGPAIATRLFTDAKFFSDDYGAVAVLVVPKDASDPDRMLMICRAYVAAFFRADEVAQDYPHARQMVTIWPVVKRSATLDPNNDNVHGAGTGHDAAICPTAVRDYDFLAAEIWLDGLPPRTVSSDARGPFLIAWTPARLAGHPNVPFLFYDLSGFETKTEFRRAMGVWADEIEGNPAAWASGWDLTRAKLNAAAMADRFGAQIETALKLVPWLGDH